MCHIDVFNNPATLMLAGQLGKLYAASPILCHVTNPCYITALPPHGNCVILQIHCGDARMGTVVRDPFQNRHPNCQLSLMKYSTQVLQIEKSYNPKIYILVQDEICNPKTSQYVGGMQLSPT